MNAKLNVLIIGDSFAADWSVKYKDYPGWPALLQQDYAVTNLAQAGVGEYKILQQLESFENLSSIDVVVVSHTSPFRVHTVKHPVHTENSLHANADLILADIEFHAARPLNFFNQSLHSAMDYFCYHFDENYYKTVYTLLREKINQQLAEKAVIAINLLPDNMSFATENTVLDFSTVWQTHPGLINHVSQIGNELIYSEIKNTINSMCIGDN